MSDLASTREELASLTHRTAVLEREVSLLREARHDHANKLVGLGEAVKQIQADLKKLAGLPDDVEKLRVRVSALEEMIRGLIEKFGSLETRIGKIEKRLAGWTMLIVLIGETLAFIAHKLW